MFLFCPIQSSLNSFTRELVILRIVGIVNRYFIPIDSTCLAGIRLFLFGINQSVSLTQCSQLRTQRIKRDLYKVLVVALSDVDFLFDSRIITNNQLCNLVINAVIDYKPCCLVQVISHLIIAPYHQLYLLAGNTFNSLLILDRLQTSIAFVVPLVDRFNWFAIHRSGCPIGINTSSKVVYSQINANRTPGIDFHWFWFYFVDKFNLEVSTVVFGVKGNFFEGFVVNAVGKVDPDFPKLFLELIGHGYRKLAVFDDQSRYFFLLLTGRLPARDYQQEVAVFWEVVRKLNSLLVASLPNCTNQSVETFECSVYYFERLLSKISVQQLLVLVNLTLVVVRFVAQVLAFLKEVLSNCVKPYVVEVLTQPAQFLEIQKLGLIEFSHLVLLRQVNHHLFATVISIQGNGRMNPAYPFSSLV